MSARGETPYDAEWLEYDDDTRPKPPWICQTCGHRANQHLVYEPHACFSLPECGCQAFVPSGLAAVSE